MGKLTAILMVLLVPLFVFAQEAPPETIEEASAFLGLLIQAIMDKNYVIAGGILLMIALIPVKEHVLPKLNISEKLMPLVSLVAGVLAQAGYSLAMGEFDSGRAIVDGIITGAFASGIWDFAGKYLKEKLVGKKSE